MDDEGEDAMTPDEHPTQRLSEYLDGELPPREAARVERHLAACDECVSVLEDLRAVVAHARTLEDRPPDRELWPGIATRIGAGSEGEVSAERAVVAGTIRDAAPGPGRTRRRRTSRRIALSLPQLAAAAAALLLLGGSGVWLWTGGPAGGDRPARGSRVADVSPSGEGAALLAGAPSGDRAEATTPTLARYQAAIAELERTLFEDAGDLDTATVRKVRESLEKVDRAIREAREALREDPGSTYLHRHLAETMRQKVRFLRETATLVSTQS